MAKKGRKRERKPPWGGVIALLGAGLVTLLGIIWGLEPATILLRAFMAAVLLSVLASVASAFRVPVPRSP